MRRHLGTIIDTFNVKKWPWLVSALAVLLVAGSLLFMSGFATPSAESVAAEQTTSPPSSSASAEPTVTTEPEQQDKKEEGRNVDSGVVGSQVDVEKPLPASQQNVPEQAGAEASPAAKPQPQIPPQPVGVKGTGSMTTVGERGSLYPGQYVFFGSPGLSPVKPGFRSWGVIGENGRSPVITLRQGDQIAFGNTVAYTLEQVAILDQYYGGVG